MDLAKPVFMIAGSWGKEPTEEVEGTEIHFAEPNLSQFDFRRGGLRMMDTNTNDLSMDINEKPSGI